jgi:hypothetical protein
VHSKFLGNLISGSVLANTAFFTIFFFGLGGAIGLGGLGGAGFFSL